MIHDTIIRVEAVQRHLPQGARELHILNGVSFAVTAGSWLALSGPSGAGKSTLLGILAGLDRPSSGKVYVEGTEINALPEGELARLRNAKIGIVFQSGYLIPTLTALENVEAPLYAHHPNPFTRVMATHMLKQVGLRERLDHFPHQLSAGEQQCVAIARALAGGPEILLADEPTGGLDAAASQQILDLIYRLRNQLGLTVIMTTRDLAVAARADRSLQLVDGRLVSLEAPQPGIPRRAAPSHTILAEQVRA